MEKKRIAEKGLTVLLALSLGPNVAAAAEPSPVASLLERAAERAVTYESTALNWTCDETVRQAKYDGNGEASRESERHFALLMGKDAAGRAPVELRAAASSTEPPSARRPGMMNGFPAVTSWLRLFHPDVGGFFLLQDRGEDGSGSVLRHAFTFRGASPYNDGDDFREWEGTAWLDPVTGDLLSVDAHPSSQKDRLAKLVDRRNRHSLGFTFFGVLRFHIGPKADGRHVEVSFGQHEGGFWLPSVARLETFKAVSQTTTSPLKVIVDSLDRCRRFETNAAPGETTPRPR